MIPSLKTKMLFLHNFNYANNSIQNKVEDASTSLQEKKNPQFHKHAILAPKEVGESRGPRECMRTVRKVMITATITPPSEEQLSTLPNSSTFFWHAPNTVLWWGDNTWWSLVHALRG
jgi:hypothetical protein